jgi:hypothetical protein
VCHQSKKPDRQQQPQDASGTTGVTIGDGPLYVRCRVQVGFRAGLNIDGFYDVDDRTWREG